jgi:hypothetical protein
MASRRSVEIMGILPQLETKEDEERRQHLRSEAIEKDLGLGLTGATSRTQESRQL